MIIAELRGVGYSAPRDSQNFPMKRNKRRPNEEASYLCDACGQEIVIPVDLSAGESQEYVEDCPVCCRPNIIHVDIDDGGGVRVWAEAE